MQERHSFFFTDFSKISQSNLQSFGPVYGDEENQFRLTSKFSVSGEANAYAICKGNVLIVPFEDSTEYVNLVLKPFEQPILDLNIKYFIYRKLKRSDFFTNDGKVLPSSTTSTEFIKQLNFDYKSFHSDKPVVPDFLASFIGFSDIVESEKLIDEMFFNKSIVEEVEEELVEVESTAFELPLVNSGVVLGKFVSQDCGIDVILNNGSYKVNEENLGANITFEYACNEDPIMTFDGAIAEDIKKIKKESINFFIDITAFYSAYINGEELHLKQRLSNLDSKVIDKNNIYNQIISKFHTSNCLYIQIISDRNRSYNFYNNYTSSIDNSKDILIGVDVENLVEQSYATFGWPVLIYNSTLDSNSNLLIKLTTNNLSIANLFFEYDSNRKNNGVFLNNEFLIDTSTEQDGLSYYSSSIPIQCNSIELSGIKYPISGLIRIHYLGMDYRVNYEEESVLLSDFNPSNLFGLFNTSQLINIDNEIDGNSIVNEIRQSAMYEVNKKNYLVLFNYIKMFTKFEDLSGEIVTPVVTYMSYQVDGPLFNYKSSNFSEDSPNDNVLYRSNFPKCKKGLMQLNGEEIKTLAIQFSYPGDFRYFLGMTQAEHTLLDAVVIESELKNPSIILMQISAFGFFTSDNGIEYSYFQLGVLGENNGELHLLSTEEPIIIYTLDYKIFYTKNYSKDFIVLDNKYLYEIPIVDSL
jgi:hypothetical protein